MPEPALSDAADGAALYEVVPENFIAARDALVRRLRSAGDKAEAARVAKLRRPPLTAWALNQVARAAPEQIESLQQAGARLRAAMEQALGGDASGLRQAQTEERRAVDSIVADAIGRLQQGGYSPTDVMFHRMAATLRAAIVDESVAALLRRGVLEGDRDAPGFGMDALSAVPAPVPAPLPAEAPPKTEWAPTSDPRRAELAARRDEVRQESERSDQESSAQAAEADRWAAEAARLAAEAREARDRSSAARQRADAASQAAADRRAEADRLDQELAALVPRET